MTAPAAPRMTVQQADITTLKTDAIVNAANEALAPGGGVCGAIHRAAGPDLARACAEAGPCPTGEARLTPGYRLPARHVIHAVGPVWRGGDLDEADLLAACYANALTLAAGAGCRSIAFPAISTGIFGYPVDAAARIAVAACGRWLEGAGGDLTVIFCCYDAETASLYERVLTQ